MEGQQDIQTLLSENDELKTQLLDYKNIAQSLERRIADLHNDCDKKDQEIARLKVQLKSASNDNASGKVTELCSEDEEVLRKMFIGGLNSSTTNESLRSYFSQFGEVASTTVMVDPSNGRSRGFGFVIFTSPDALDAVQAARPHEIDGRVVDTKRALPKSESGKMLPGSKTNRVFIGGLKTTTTSETLLEYFSQYGHVEFVDLPEEKGTQRRRGFGYVAFDDFDPVDKVTILRHHVIDGRRCEVKKALTRSEMESLKSATSAPPADGSLATMSNQMAGPNQSYGPYGTPAANMAFQQGSWSQGAGNVDENAAAGNYGYMGAPCNHNMNAPYGHFCQMGLGNVAGMLGSMLANLGAQGANMANMPGAAGPNMVPGQNAGNMPGAVAKGGHAGPMRGGSSFMQRGSGPYGGGYGVSGGKHSGSGEYGM